MMLPRLLLSTAALTLVVSAARADEARTIFDEKVAPGVIFKLANVTGDVKVGRSTTDKLQVIAQVSPFPKEWASWSFRPKSCARIGDSPASGPAYSDPKWLFHPTAA